MTPESNTLFSHQLITKGDLQEFRNHLLSDLKEILKGKSEEKQWLKSSEVRKLLKISPGTLQNLRVNGTLRYSKVGSIIYYKYDDILKVLTP